MHPFGHNSPVRPTSQTLYVLRLYDALVRVVRRRSHAKIKYAGNADDQHRRSIVSNIKVIGQRRRALRPKS